ncbi:hypothetical protein HanPI659440_Chr13g0500641 [Helianthus annuus]|nr:hypothetical protein HanPI659440_Chr13g0500641 [Helianthus annuus]
MRKLLVYRCLFFTEEDIKSLPYFQVKYSELADAATIRSKCREQL